MKREETVDHHIKTCWHAIYRMYNEQAMKHGTTTSMGFVALNIDPKEGTPATKIAPLIGLESRSLSRTLKDMEKKGFIYRKKDPRDGRSIRIFLTALGEEKREISRETVIRFNEIIRESVSPQKLEIFFEVIETINQLVGKKEIF